MRYLSHFTIVGLITASALLSGCSTASRSYNKGADLEEEQRYEEAMYSYADAFAKAPDSSLYRMRYVKVRELAADQRYKKGMELFNKGDYASALAEFQTASTLDPSRGRFVQQAAITARLKDAQSAYNEGLDFEKTNKFKDAALSFAKAIELNPDNKDYQAAQSRVLLQRKSKLQGYELNLKSAKPINLKFRDAKIKDVFNIITQLSGINFVFDESVKDQPVTIYLENGTFQQALDLLTNMFKLGRKIASESTVIIYAKSPEKSKQYEDLQLRTFHLNYMDAKKAVNLIRGMLQVKKIYVNEETNSVVLRDTNEVVDVVEKILDANDVPDPEVILDVEVIEVNDSNTQRLGLLLNPYSVSLGAFSPSNQLMSTTLSGASNTVVASGSTVVNTSSTSIDNLVRAFTMRGYGGYVTVPNATYNFGKTLSKGEVLSNPKIRVKNKEKSKFNVGTRVPITTSNTTNSTVSVNVQYIDIGVKMSAEPNIQLNNEIVIKLSLEVSQQIGGARDVGAGTSVVTIGTRNLDTVLSLKDGETSIIGGLISRSNGNEKNKLILLSDIPLIGDLFTDTNTNNSKNELLLAITPRLVRGVTVPQNSLMSFSSGKEDDPSLAKSLASFNQEPVYDVNPSDQKPANLPPGFTMPPMNVQPPAFPNQNPEKSAVKPVLPSTPFGMPSQPQAGAQPIAPMQLPGNLPPGFTPPVMPVPTPVSPTPPIAPPVTAEQALPGMLQISAPSNVTIGQQFGVVINLNNAADIVTAPFVLNYDPAYVQFVSAMEGSFFTKAGKTALFSSKPDPKAGTVEIRLVKSAGDSGVTGSGDIATVLFRAVNKGSASFNFTNLAFSAADGKSATILPFSTLVEIK
jgi:general secretion pathway protein D